MNFDTPSIEVDCRIQSGVLDEIRAEREYQNGEWGTEFDDKNTLNDWVTYIANYASQAAGMETPPEDQRKNMLKVATLAVAAVESFNRNGQFAPRHYEDRVPAGTRPGDKISEAWSANEVAAQKPAEPRSAYISLHDEIAIIRTAIERLMNGIKPDSKFFTDADLAQRSRSLCELMRTMERLVKAAVVIERQGAQTIAAELRRELRHGSPPK